MKKNVKSLITLIFFVLVIAYAFLWITGGFLQSYQPEKEKLTLKEAKFLKKWSKRGFDVDFFHEKGNKKRGIIPIDIKLKNSLLEKYQIIDQLNIISDSICKDFINSMNQEYEYDSVNVLIIKRTIIPKSRRTKDSWGNSKTFDDEILLMKRYKWHSSK